MLRTSTISWNAIDGFLHRDHRLVQLIIFAEQHVARHGLGLCLLRIDRTDQLIEDLAEARGLRRAFVPGKKCRAT